MSNVDVRTPYADAAPVVDGLIARLRPFADGLCTAAGSFLRQRATIGDLEIVAIPGTDFHAELDRMVESGEIEKSPLRGAWGKKQRKFTYQGMHVDLYMCDHDNAGYILWIRTGNNDGGDGNKRVLDYINRCREKSSDKPQFELHDGYVWHGEKKLHIPDETAFYALLGIPYIEPQNRDGATYQRLFKAKDHKWGDVTPFLPAEPEPELTPQQASMQLFDSLPSYGADGGKSGNKAALVAMYEAWAEQDERIAARMTDPAKRKVYESFAQKWRDAAARELAA